MKNYMMTYVCSGERTHSFIQSSVPVKQNRGVNGPFGTDRSLSKMMKTPAKSYQKPDLRRTVLWGVLFGLWTGAALGLFLKLVQATAGSLVYTLLLNVDFIPLTDWTGMNPLPEWFEFSLHLAVSVIIGILYVLMIRRGFRPRATGFVLGMLPSVLFIPLTLLSERTPQVTDMEALAWWLAGHFIYCVLLARCGAWYLRKLIQENKKNRH